MSSLEDFYQELDARMALPDNDDSHEPSSWRKASHKYSFPDSISTLGLIAKQNDRSVFEEC
jgi:hypothetical protein